MKINVNGRVHDVDVEPDMPLLWVLRDVLKMAGTKYGCGIAQCGACTVHIDGVASRSCSMPISAVTEQQKIVTIEGLSANVTHPIQKAWLELDVPQCGYGQSGQIRLGDSQNIIAVAQLSDGTFWSGSAELIVTLPACMETN